MLTFADVGELDRINLCHHVSQHPPTHLFYLNLIGIDLFTINFVVFLPLHREKKLVNK